MTVAPQESENQAEWIMRFQAGDPVVFADIYAKYANDLLAYFAARKPTRTPVEDLTQATWTKIWKYRTNFTYGSFRPWMYKVASSILTDHWRLKLPDLLAENFDPSEPTFDHDDSRLAALRECLKNVEGTFVEVVRGRVQGLSTERLCEQYQVNAKTIATRIHRGKQLLRECVERKLQ